MGHFEPGLAAAWMRQRRAGMVRSRAADFRKLHDLPIDVEVYAPYGTPKQQLTNEFLAAPSQMSLDGKGRKPDPLKPEWVVLMEVLRELEAQPYANPVGRTIFQKISYVVTEMGVPTGFRFSKGSYGPFSGDVKLALHDFANRNWLNEQQLGRMIALRVAPQYERDRGRYKELIERYQAKIAKAVDLFSRIKSTEQAEEVLTVFFAARQLKQSRRDGDVAEQDLQDYILDWKKSWRADEKKHAVANAIRNLVLLGWLRLTISESISEAGGAATEDPNRPVARFIRENSAERVGVCRNNALGVRRRRADDSPNPSSKRLRSNGWRRWVTPCCTGRRSRPARPPRNAMIPAIATWCWIGGCARRWPGSIRTCRPRRWRMPTAS